MEFEWDEAKRRRNLAKHGYDFRDAARADWDYAILLKVEYVDGEERELQAVPLSRALIAIVLVERGERRRVVMMRGATPVEKHKWRAELAQR